MVEIFFVCLLASIPALSLTFYIEEYPGDWEERYGLCGGFKQSPIDIVTANVTYNHELNEFLFTGNYNYPIEGAEIRNKGHTVDIRLPLDIPKGIRERGSNEKHNLQYIDFHWGSEHTIDGQRFPLEMHLVHTSARYRSKRILPSDRVSILAVLFKLTDEDNPALEPIIGKLEDIKAEDSSARLDGGFRLFDLMPSHLMPYYRYEGSLTYPPCYENVKWSIFKEFAPISSEQLRMFRNLEGEVPSGIRGAPIENNYRPIQQLHNRTVQESGDPYNGYGWNWQSVLTALL